MDSNAETDVLGFFLCNKKQCFPLADILFWSRWASAVKSKWCKFLNKFSAGFIAL